MSRVLLAAQDLTLRAGERLLVSDFALEVHAGECIALLGRNGAGKTLTLHALAGLIEPDDGTVSLDGRALDTLPRRTIAQRIGILFQDLESGHATTALDAVLVGRHPHLDPWQWERNDDRRLARAMLARVGLAGVTERTTTTLSGGELRRVAMASLLAQQPAVYLLDEPTNHLDPHQQLEVLEMFREQNHGGHAVVATLHDPTLAARFADRAVLLHGDGRWLAGAVDDVLTLANLESLYLMKLIEAEVGGRRVFVPA